MENVTISAYCNLTIDHHTPTVSQIERLDIKSYGTLNIVTDLEATTRLTGLELDVRSGAKVSEDSTE